MKYCLTGSQLNVKHFKQFVDLILCNIRIDLILF